jgi:heme-degrading monooxygenase HmoA
MRITHVVAALSLAMTPFGVCSQPMPPDRLFEAPGLVSFDAQLADAEEGEIVLINTFRVAAGQESSFLAGWTQAAAALGRHPGLLRATMHRGLAGSPLWVNVAVWRSAGELRAALADPAFAQAARAIGAPFYRQLYANEGGR